VNCLLRFGAARSAVTRLAARVRKEAFGTSWPPRARQNGRRRRMRDHRLRRAIRAAAGGLPSLAAVAAETHALD